MKPTPLALTSCICLAALLTSASLAQNPAAPLARPAIVGVAHIGLKTNDLAAARKFTHGILASRSRSAWIKRRAKDPACYLPISRSMTTNTLKCFPS